MKGTIAVLPGDGIGREIMTSALRVLEAVNTRFGHTFEATEAAVGVAAYDSYGEHLPKETIAICEASDAILFGAVGGPSPIRKVRGGRTPRRRSFWDCGRNSTSLPTCGLCACGQAPNTSVRSSRK